MKNVKERILAKPLGTYGMVICGPGMCIFVMNNLYKLLYCSPSYMAYLCCNTPFIAGGSEAYVHFCTFMQHLVKYGLWPCFKLKICFNRKHILTCERAKNMGLFTQDYCHLSVKGKNGMACWESKQLLHP